MAKNSFVVVVTLRIPVLKMEGGCEDPIYFTLTQMIF